MSLPSIDTKPTALTWALSAWPLVCSFGLTFACVSQSEQGQETAARRTDKLSLAATGGVTAKITRLSSTVEVEVIASKPFPDTQTVPLLLIGDKVFSLSRNPPDGRQETLIFTIAAADFDALPGTADLSVGYLSPDARVAPGKRATAGAKLGPAVSGPEVRPDQVQQGQRRVGSFDKASLRVLP